MRYARPRVASAGFYAHVLPPSRLPTLPQASEHCTRRRCRTFGRTPHLLAGLEHGQVAVGLGVVAVNRDRHLKRLHGTPRRAGGTEEAVAVPVPATPRALERAPPPAVDLRVRLARSETPGSGGARLKPDGSPRPLPRKQALDATLASCLPRREGTEPRG